ncbi:MAG: hypothetical protein BWY59_00085 [Verrucomicrobia bacterium ADurb.Bin345]|nr:MAG: hypothetical protein BWY59_00085 [Verrucomicrobia bacterium ADurb.Bin345]
MERREEGPHSLESRGRNASAVRNAGEAEASAQNPALRLRPRRRAAARADGQLRGRAPEHRRRAHRQPGADADYPRHRKRAAVQQPGPDLGDGRSPAAGQRAAFPGPAFGRRRAQPYRPPLRPAGHGQGPGAYEGLRARPARRPRRAAGQRGGLCAAAAGEADRPGHRADCHPPGPLLGHGPRQHLGAG